MRESAEQMPRLTHTVAVVSFFDGWAAGDCTAERGEEDGEDA